MPGLLNCFGGKKKKTKLPKVPPTPPTPPPPQGSAPSDWRPQNHDSPSNSLVDYPGRAHAAHEQACPKCGAGNERASSGKCYEKRTALVRVNCPPHRDTALEHTHPIYGVHSEDGHGRIPVPTPVPVPVRSEASGRTGRHTACSVCDHCDGEHARRKEVRRQERRRKHQSEHSRSRSGHAVYECRRVRH